MAVMMGSGSITIGRRRLLALHLSAEDEAPLFTKPQDFGFAAVLVA